MKSTFLAYFFVAIQMSCLLMIFASSPVICNSEAGIMVEIAGFFLGVLAIVNMQIGNFNIAPIPKVGGKLITNGLYQYIRHPMYLAQLMATLPLIYDYYSLPRLFVWLALLVNLIFKLHYEENKLVAAHPDYKEYMANSWRLIPFIY